jgi:hypothetical protein
MNLDVPKDQHEELQRHIASENSPLRIDATKTHVLTTKLRSAPLSARPLGRRVRR